ncbi:30S ribosomal protein S17 [Corynebacterium sp. CCUG 70398]|uniref:30S ribosomal protein S17 n=1 Tax=Corynebacterium sp. CCUG 70398 TaxID=2823891 RepID=UPI00210DACA3|nr:30S ribosomal protein S17 [Corynebacterium sp. CCUG 70398]MCQ4617629.1 30S ribosomal protein S17 [Corynebacterium pseudogenitalium]MCQ4622458.1 30S ribosomal protein S17 [Corynebacterium sp. CCUG 70398]
MTEATGTATGKGPKHTETQPKEKGLQKRRRGYVVSDKMDKTIVVEVEDRKSHALYGKIVRTTKRVKAHDENNEAGVGDLVHIIETRPLSKDKHFRLLDIVEKAR